MRPTPRIVWKLALFAALNLADMVLTWMLVRQAGGTVYEANPLANWWLASFGWWGLALYKLLTALLAGGLCLVIARRNPRTADRVLILGCSVLAVVVLYSCSLAGYTHHEASATEVSCSRSPEPNQRLLECRPQ